MCDTPWNPAESSRVRGQRGAEISTIAQSWGYKSLEVKSYQVRRWDSVPWPGKTAGFYLNSVPYGNSEQRPEDKPVENIAHTVSFLSSKLGVPSTFYLLLFHILSRFLIIISRSFSSITRATTPTQVWFLWKSFSPGKKCKCILQTVIKPKKLWLQTYIKTLNFSRAKDKINKLPWYLLFLFFLQIPLPTKGVAL